MKQMFRMLKNTQETKKSLAMGLLTGVLMACAITCIVIIGCAVLLTYTSMTEQTLPFIITIACAVSAIVAGFDTAKAAEGKGWLWGIVAGGIFAFILVSVEMWVQKTVSLDTRTITLMILALAGGGLGGIFGINFK